MLWKSLAKVSGGARAGRGLSWQFVRVRGKSFSPAGAMDARSSRRPERLPGRFGSPPWGRWNRLEEGVEQGVCAARRGARRARCITFVRVGEGFTTLVRVGAGFRGQVDFRG